MKSISEENDRRTLAERSVDLLAVNWRVKLVAIIISILCVYMKHSGIIGG